MDEPKVLFGPVWAGFRKWSMAYNEYGHVVIGFSREPLYGEISLADASIEDLTNLSEMFARAAAKFQIEEDERQARLRAK